MTRFLSSLRFRLLVLVLLASAPSIGLIEATTTEQGLTVKAILSQKDYATEIKISDAQMAALNVQKHETLPQWNYTIKPLAETR